MILQFWQKFDDDDEETNKGLWPRGDKLSRGQKYYLSTKDTVFHFTRISLYTAFQKK